MTDLPFDPSNPPADPPRGADRLLWRLGYALLQAHEVRADGFCNCREFAPCSGIRLAVRGLMAACMPRRCGTYRANGRSRTTGAWTNWDVRPDRSQ